MEVHVDGKRVGGNATFMRVALDESCKEVLFEFLAMYASSYNPLPISPNVVMMCVKNYDTIHDMHASDVGSIHGCSVFLGFLVWMVLSEVPTQMLAFKCTRPIEEARPPRQDHIVVMMAQRNTRCLHLPPIRIRIVISGKDVLYDDFRR